MATSLRNIIVVGGSFVGRTTAQELARIVPSTHRPRFAIVPGQEHKAFIPYSGIFKESPYPSSHGVVQARVLSVKPAHIELDREWQGSKVIPFDYVVLATGTRLSKPAAMDDDDKASSVDYLQKHQAGVKRSHSILIVGGGAVGVQMATDLKEYYPEKEVTVVQSRPRVMPSFHSGLHDLIKQRFDELGIRLITSSRVTIPPGGFPNDGSTFEVHLTNGTTESTQFVILATGQTPNSQLVTDLKSSRLDGEAVINPDNGFIRVRPTMQFLDEQYSNMFAVGDIADTGAQKAARPGSAQAAVVAKNIQALIEGRAAEDTFKHNVIFRNPNAAESQTEPWINVKDDGREDMNVEAMWERLGISVEDPRQYHL
ncbi:Pyridine nucleotide-disulfide oxidoreductase, class-II [Penicillium griseofulvum]|uniref:Pyridine nucleotide-disulfide oxidoreductase, class-II n=1 Tax=Penicillium patulum TaxID=5078 RepID=A0A135LS12_PENPA|nr:Pyridine nucleotide-disulfide oxidoreductase, class-II [Penicillium griseofulvum]KXG51742.1 Pyridine nucleotide-disulfide oxidoreductase, class-II [Penicillium griseofulvum]